MALCAGAMPFASSAAEKPVPLPVPPLLESRRGQPVFLTLQPVHWAFISGSRAGTWGINGQYPPPTVRVRSGDDVKLIYSNRLDKHVAMTVCGLQVPGSLAGGAPRLMSPNSEWAPVLPVRQPAATLWYRASTPEYSASQVYNGLAGMWLVEDRHSELLPLPRHYGVDDFPVIIQDKQFDRFGVPEYNPPASGGFLGNVLLVNGVQNPYLEVSRGWIRLRLLNASNARRYLLQTSDQRPLYVIASDQGLLNTPVAVSQLSLAPGERREILLDMNEGKEVTIITDESAGLIDRLRGIFEPSTILSSNRVLTIKASGLLSLVTTPLAETLLTEAISPGVPEQSRNLVFGNTPGINGQLWDVNRIDITARQGSWERWTVQSDQPQSFHIEGARFLLEKVNGAPPFPEDRGWKDTVWVDGQLELLVHFTQTSSPRYPLIYASQTLEMLDRGSMGQILVTPSS